MSGRNDGLPSKLLIVDDDESVAQRLEGPLRTYGVEVIRASSIEAATFHYDEEDFDVAIVEIEFGQLPGLMLVQFWRDHQTESKRDTAFIMSSGTTRAPTDEQLMKELGGFELLPKPFNLIQVLPFLSRAMVRAQKQRQFARFRREVLEIAAQEGKLEEAIEKTKAQLKTWGSRAFTVMVEAYNAAGQHEQALEVINVLMQKDAGDIAVWHLHGETYFHMENYNDAVMWLQKAYDVAPMNLKRMELITQAYISLGDAKKAEGFAMELIGNYAVNAKERFDIFDRFLAEGHEEQAKKICQKTTPPKEVLRYYNNLGVQHSKEGDHEKAVDAYEKALLYYPDYKDNFRIRFNLALAYTHSKTYTAYSEAEKHLLLCLEAQPDFEKATKVLGHVRKVLAGRDKKSAPQAS